MLQARDCGAIEHPIGVHEKVVTICYCDQSELNAIHEGLVTMAKDWIAPKTFGLSDENSKSTSQSGRDFNSNFNLDDHEAQLGLRGPRGKRGSEQKRTAIRGCWRGVAPVIGRKS